MSELPPDHLSAEVPVLPASRISDELVAIIPAAGLSRRMGQPKLLLSLGGRPVISRVIETLRAAGLSRIVVTVRSEDRQLIDAVTASGGRVVIPDPPPPDMRHSVESALRILLDGSSISVPWKGWMLIPADHPTLNTAIVSTIIAGWTTSPDRISVPVHRGRRGHPTILPRHLASLVFSLPADRGINHLVRAQQHQIMEVEVNDPAILEDLDTPEDWTRIRARWSLMTTSPDSTE